MKIVALTGGIGSGKSTVAKMFMALGVPVYNSDKEAKALLHRSTSIKNALIDLLGEKAFSGEKLNKTYVADQIFADSALLQKMNNIIHPAVRKHFLKWAAKQKTPYVIQEAAIIFENGNQGFYDAVILVIAPQDTRIERVTKRDDVSREQVLARIANQWDDKKKIALSDFIINNIDIDATTEKVSEINTALLENS
ncbi:dephospho-CoA kinase [Aggregatimonas sangjinii]|uniref:Dephospho-CoA kinase n=1 Tax=Aggregatimonas sangjinii TaxID=2583587 RepID=A0A5B7SU54_9FLAO|nr:dephospho-CoA kinase [Aggregatimonas sangjinii]QCX00254.1 dephospho-CoA kinase [Aggregatimonas sangjinii]